VVTTAFAANSRFVAATLPVGRLVRCSNKKKSFT